MLFQENDSGREEAPDSGPRYFFRILAQEAPAVLQLNMIFLLSCLPVVTIPAALAALHRTVRRMLEGRAVRSWRHYWEAFRQDWRWGYGAFALTALPLAAGGYGAWFYLRFAETNALCYLPFAFCAVVFLTALPASSYLWGLLAAGRRLTGETVRLAVRLGLGKPLRALLAAAGWYGCLAVGILWLPLSGLWLLLAGFSAPCLLRLFLVRTVLARFGGDENESRSASGRSGG